MVFILGIFPSFWPNLSIQYSDVTDIDLDSWTNARRLRAASPLWQKRQASFKLSGLCLQLLNFGVWLRVKSFVEWWDRNVCQDLMPLNIQFSACCCCILLIHCKKCVCVGGGNLTDYLSSVLYMMQTVCAKPVSIWLIKWCGKEKLGKQNMVSHLTENWLCFCVEFKCFCCVERAFSAGDPTIQGGKP